MNQTITYKFYRTARPTTPAVDRRKALANEARLKELTAIKRAGMMYAMSQLVEDMMQELINIPEGKKMRYEINRVFEWIGKPRRRYSRVLNERDRAILNDTLLDIADSSEEYVDNARRKIRETMDNKLDQPSIRMAEILGFTNGLITCMQETHKSIYGKYSSDYKEAGGYVDEMIQRTKFYALKQNVEVRIEDSNDAVVQMFQAIGKQVEMKLFVKRQCNEQ